jgi:hypothetical protein
MTQIDNSDCWSTDPHGEEWTREGHRSAYDALVEEIVRKEDRKPGVYKGWIGESQPYSHDQFVSNCFGADDIIDVLGNSAHAEVGEHADEYPDIHMERMEECAAKVRELILETLNKHSSEPHFYTVHNLIVVTVNISEDGSVSHGWSTPAKPDHKMKCGADMKGPGEIVTHSTIKEPPSASMPQALEKIRELATMFGIDPEELGSVITTMSVANLP